jgi:hypothetical protein
MDAELKTRIWVDALRWRAEGGGAAFYLVKRGDADAGGVLVRTDDLAGGVRLYAGARDFEGARIWMEPLGPGAVEPERAARYVARRLEDDPDLWVVEIEDRDGRHFLTEPIEKS